MGKPCGPQGGGLTPSKPGGGRWGFGLTPAEKTPPPFHHRLLRALRIRFALVVPAAALFFLLGLRSHRAAPAAVPPVTAKAVPIPPRLDSLPPPKNFPGQDTLAFAGRNWITEYAADSLLQARALHYLNQYRPEGAVVAVCDLHSGLMRALAERDSTGSRSRPELALEAQFPAASLIKILTASAALDGRGETPDDSLPLLGRNHTLYRFQLRPPEHGSYPRISLTEAFARSINPVFGLLGLQLGPAPLRKMAAALGFNRPGPLDEWKSSHLDIPDSGFPLAETACGFTTATTISPLHALEIARSVGDDGHLLPPRFTSGLKSLQGDTTRVLPFPIPTEPFISTAALAQLRSMLSATVASGTARRGFRRNLRRQDWDSLDLGGKTGSLDGEEPPGRYEWYIGYARFKDHPGDGIAVAVMLINQHVMAVPATDLAALIIRDWSQAERRRNSDAEERAQNFAARKQGHPWREKNWPSS